MSRRRPPRQRATVGAHSHFSSGVVKSAARTAEILEFFDDIQREATVVEVCDALNYPQSSTSVLLRSLAAIGYLEYDRYARTYVPTSRVAMLGQWINRPLFAEGRLNAAMEDISQATGDTVLVAMRIGMQVQYIKVIQARNPARLHLIVGTCRPLAASGAGYAILSMYSDEEIKKIIDRVNFESRSTSQPVKFRPLLERLADVRLKGYSFTTDLVSRGAGILAVPIRVGIGQPPIALGVAGISEVMIAREAFLVDTVRDAMAAHLAVRIATGRGNSAQRASM